MSETTEKTEDTCATTETAATLLSESANHELSIPKTKPQPARSLQFSINTYIFFILATLFVFTGLLLLRWPLSDLFNDTRLLMLPAFPPFKLWAKPAPIVYCRAYVFAVTNADGFLSGTDNKIKFKEVGPIIFREHLEHNDIVVHDNSTLSYTVRRYLEFLPELNEPGILNKTFTFSNIVLLGMATRLANHMFTIKMPFNYISREDQVFVNRTLYEYFWNFTTPALLTVDTYLPFLLPQDNGGALHTVYMDFEDRVNVRIGPKYTPQEFFTINTFDYRPTVPGYKPEHGDCFADLMNSSEGAFYPNSMPKDEVIYYWRKTVCRPIPLYFQEDVDIGFLKGRKYVTRQNWYDRTEDLATDCYKGMGRTILPDGLSDVSKCYNNLPIAVSSPHFYGRSGYWDYKTEGYTPNYESHASYAIIEPINGVPLDQKARSQSNLVLPKLSGFNPQVNLFSEIVVPIVWLEYHQPELTTELTALLVFATRIVPAIEYVIPVIFLGLGLVLYLVFARRVNGSASLGGYTKIKMLWHREKAQFFETKT